MDRDWFECTKMVAYYLWEHTGYENALSLWYAAEDIACFFEQTNILELGMVDSIIRLGLRSEGYIWFLRHISYRLYLHTGNTDELANWYLAECLLGNPAWVQCLEEMANLLSSGSAGTIGQVRSDIVRSYYE